jgi:hypothetical protein
MRSRLAPFEQRRLTDSGDNLQDPQNWGKTAQVIQSPPNNCHHLANSIKHARGDGHEYVVLATARSTESTQSGPRRAERVGGAPDENGAIWFNGSFGSRTIIDPITPPRADRDEQRGERNEHEE